MSRAISAISHYNHYVYMGFSEGLAGDCSLTGAAFYTVGSFASSQHDVHVGNVMIM